MAPVLKRYTARYQLGTRVKKRFEGYDELFGGTIDEHSTVTGFYHISYDDGDSEEMIEDEVEEVVDRPAPRDTEAKGSQDSTPSGRILEVSTHASDLEPPVERPATPPPGTQFLHRPVKIPLKKGEQEEIFDGTITSYFHATKKYRILLVSGMTVDMSYAEVKPFVSSGEKPPIVIDASTPSTKEKDKSSRKKKESVASPGTNSKDKAGVKRSRQVDAPASAQSPVESAPVTKQTEGKIDMTQASKKQKKEGGRSPRDTPTSPKVIHEEKETEEVDPSFPAVLSVLPDNISSQHVAYTVLRSLLYIIISSQMEDPSEDESRHFKVLGNEAFSAEKAIRKFIRTGGLSTLCTILSKWTEERSEKGIFLILKVLAVLPNVSSDMIAASRIGKAVVKVKKRDKGRLSLDVGNFAAYVIDKWKSDFGMKPKSPKEDEKPPSKLPTKETKPKEKASGTTSTRPSNNMKRSLASKSQKHLENLMGDSNGQQDVLGSALGVKKSYLGASHARVARRSTQLLDSIDKMSTKKASEEAAQAKVTAEEDLAHASTRISFGPDKAIRFDQRLEVSRLLSTNLAPRPPSLPYTGKIKSILKVRTNVQREDATVPMTPRVIGDDGTMESTGEFEGLASVESASETVLAKPTDAQDSTSRRRRRGTDNGGTKDVGVDFGLSSCGSIDDREVRVDV